MSDIQTIWDIVNIRGDWHVTNGDLASGNDLQTATIISLMTDRVADPGDKIPDGSNDPRGWWGDIQTDGSVTPIGSRIWLLTREKQTQDTLNRAITYAKEALAWMLSDGVAARINVAGNWNRPGFLALLVTIFKQDGTFIALNFNWAWNQT